MTAADELGHVARALDELTDRLDALERERAALRGRADGACCRASATTCARRSPRCGPRSRRWPTASRPTLIATCARCARDVEALGALVDDLFLLARIECGPPRAAPRPVDLAELADEAVEALAPAAAASGVALALRSPGAVRVHGNAAALGRVIRNLIDNAIRHAPAGTTVDVVVDADGTPPRSAWSTTGPGFPRRVRRPTRSSASPGPTPAATGRPAAPGSGWSSPGASSRPTADGSGSRSRPAATSPSSCPSRSRPEPVASLVGRRF